MLPPRVFVCVAGAALLSLQSVPAQNAAAPTPAVSRPASANAASSPASRAAAVEKPAKPASPPEPHLTVNWVHVDEPYIALTFDDGPHGELTPKLLDTLAEHHIKATFFVLGQCVQEFPDIVKRAAREGHEIASHSWSHPQLNKMSDEAVRSQLRRTDDIIKQVTGKRPTLFRPPYGALTTRQQKWIKEEFGYEIIIWDVDPLDWKRPGPQAVTNRIMREVRAGSIVLSHDIHPGTIQAMPATFSQLEAKNFKFVTVSELLSLHTPEPPKPKPTEKPQVQAKNGPAVAATPASDAAPGAQKPAQPAPPATSPPPNR